MGVFTVVAALAGRVQSRKTIERCAAARPISNFPSHLMEAPTCIRAIGFGTSWCR